MLVALFLFLYIKYDINEILMNHNNDEYKKIKIFLGIILGCLSLYFNISKKGLNT
jgi:succinate-acetate transporter protein